MTEKLTKTVAVVKAPREFETGDGKPLTGHDVIFDDGDEGGVVTSRNADDVTAMHEALEGLKGKTIEFEVDGSRVYNNTTIWKVKNFPGKPRGAGGGGGGGRKDWVDTSPSVEAQTALKQAVFALGTFNPEIHTDGITEYIGLVRQTALGFARTLVDAKKITGFGQPAPEEPKQEQPAEAAQPSANGLRAMQQDAIAVFGSKAKVQIAYKKMFAEGAKFEDIEDEALMALIDEKGASE